jgi:hypothetical protein
MFSKMRFLLFLAFVFGFCNLANANVCAVYKITPKITIKTPEINKTVVQPDEPMNLTHGNVEATLVNNYEVVVDVRQYLTGFCVILKSVDATIGYKDFLVQIDKRHEPESCAYNVILDHENQHIDAYLSVIEDYKKDLHESLYSAANSIMPVFVQGQSDVVKIVDVLNDKLQKHPDIVLTIQKIHADEEIKNKVIDEHEDYSELKKCLE